VDLRLRLSSHKRIANVSFLYKSCIAPVPNTNRFRLFSKAGMMETHAPLRRSFSFPFSLLSTARDPLFVAKLVGTRWEQEGSSIGYV